MTHRELQLRSDLLQAFENWIGGMVTGPWENLADTLVGAVTSGTLSASDAARLDLQLARTLAITEPDECRVCDCPIPGQQHAGLCNRFHVPPDLDETSGHTS